MNRNEKKTLQKNRKLHEMDYKEMIKISHCINYISRRNREL